MLVKLKFTGITLDRFLIYPTQFVAYWASFIAPLTSKYKIRVCKGIIGLVSTSEMHPVLALTAIYAFIPLLFTLLTRSFAFCAREFDGHLTESKLHKI